MEISQKIVSEISQITREIEEHYPELLKYLSETPMTLPDATNKSPDMNDMALKDYLESLKEIVKKYKAEH